MPEAEIRERPNFARKPWPVIIHAEQGRGGGKEIAAAFAAVARDCGFIRLAVHQRRPAMLDRR